MQPVEVPGMQITFQSPVGPSGKGISFVLAVESAIETDDLNRRLDVIAAATRRQDAFEQLRLDQQSLAANRKLLVKAKAALSAAEQQLQGKVTLMSANRRRPVDATQAAPQQVSSVSQHQQRILEIEGQIAGCEERIPFWKAILRGEEPIDLDEFTRMAAE